MRHTSPRDGHTVARDTASYLEVEPVECRRMLNDCVRVVGTELGSDDGSADIPRIEAILDEVAGWARSGTPLAAGCDYASFLRNLSDIYAHGWEQQDNAAFAGTATAYAAVIEAVSRVFPDFDYTAPLGQLLELMTRLFRIRDNRWKVVYKHLRAIPDAVRAKQTLSRVCSADIREWFDAGVQNLFALREDLSAKIDEIATQATKIEAQVLAREGAFAALRRQLDPAGEGRVVVLDRRARQQEIEALKLKKDELLEQKAGRESTLGLIESDIREFENILREARRAYYLRVV